MKIPLRAFASFALTALLFASPVHAADAPASPAPATDLTLDKVKALVAALAARDSGDLTKARELLGNLNASYPDDPQVKSLLASVNDDLAHSKPAAVATAAP